MPTETLTMNPSAERNSVADIVFDMDDNLTRLQANLAVLDELTEAYRLKGATENQENVNWMLGKVIGCVAELRERWKPLFAMTCGKAADKGTDPQVGRQEPPNAASNAPAVRLLADLPKFSEMSFAELAGVYDAVNVAGEVFLGFGGQPRLEDTLGGKFVDTLCETMGDLESAIADELERRQPMREIDAERKADILARHNIAGGDYDAARVALTNLRLFEASNIGSRA